MKQKLISSGLLIISLLTVPVIHTEPFFDFSPINESGVSDISLGVVGSAALVDLPFAIEAQWNGTPQWMTGVDFNLETFNESIAKGASFFGSNLAASQYATVSIRLNNDPAQWSNAQIIRRDAILGRPYEAFGVGTFPGSVWDVSDPNNPVRLNICFAELDDGSDPIPPPNGVWDPDSSIYGKFEYLFIMRSSYDSTGNTYAGVNMLYDTLDLMYTWCPRVAAGHTFFETDSAELVITPRIGLQAYPFNTNITLVWVNPGPEPFEFKIFYSNDSTPDELLVQLTGDAQLYSHNQLLPGQEYFYQILSYDAFGNIMHSSPVVSGKTRSITAGIDYFGQWDGRSNYGGLWGYTDSLTGKEYALLCCRSQGLSIIDIGATPPVEVGFVSSPTNNIGTQEVRTYSHYAVTVMDGYPSGIIDLADVANPQVIATIPNGQHTLQIYEHYVFLAGGGGASGLEIYSIQDPSDPQFVSLLNPYYYHDFAIRNDTMAAFAIYGQGVDIIDLTNIDSPVVIAQFNYPNSGAHNGVFSDDGKYLFVGDEIGNGRWTRVFDISDLQNISMVSEIIVNPTKIVHNCELKNGHLFIAHYGEGLRVWNVFDPLEPYEVDFYDAHPENASGYYGAWSPYPFFASDKVIVSDMQHGLLVFLATYAETNCCDGVRGNVNNDASELDALDLVYLVNYIFRYGPEPVCPEEADVNSDGKMGTIHDLVFIINVLYRFGPVPGACP